MLIKKEVVIARHAQFANATRYLTLNILFKKVRYLELIHFGGALFSCCDKEKTFEMTTAIVFYSFDKT